MTRRHVTFEPTFQFSFVNILLPYQVFRALSTTPENLHSATRDCGGNGGNHIVNEGDILNGLLLRLKALRQLEIGLHFSSDANESSSPALYQNPFPDLRSLKLYLSTILAAEIFHFQKLPGVREPVIRRSRMMQTIIRGVRASSVDHLDICWTPVNPRDMDSILSFSEICDHVGDRLCCERAQWKS